MKINSDQITHCLTLCSCVCVHVWLTRIRRLPVTQFTCNVAYTPVFFKWKLLSWAVVVASATLVLALITTGLFFALNVTAACLMLPYVVWLLYLPAWTYKLWQLNPDAADAANAQTKLLGTTASP
jgi:tryptophan-rich sensory protein